MRLLHRLGVGTLVGDALWAAALAFAFSLLVFAPLLPYLDDPWSGGDMLSTYVNTRNAAVLGFAHTTQFGFPLGMDLNLSPNLDLTANWGAWAINTVFGTTFAGLNIVLIGSFPIVAALAVIALRLVGMRGPLAIALAVAYTFIPYHWGRGLGHTYLATMVSAVLGLILVLLIGSGRLLAGVPRSESGVRALRRIPAARVRQEPDARTPELRSGAAGRVGRIALLVVAVIVIAWTGLYYAAFTLLLGAAALLWRLTHGARWRALLVDALPLVGIGVLVLVAFVPSLLALADNPAARELTERSPYESVIHAGALMLALLPLPMSRLPLLDGYNVWATTAAAAGGGLESTVITNFGSWTTTFAVIIMIAGLLVPRWRARSNPMLPLLGYLSMVTLLFFVPWGLNALIANTLTPQIRAWNRLLPILLLLVILGAAAVLYRSRVNLYVRRSRPAWAVGAALVVLALTVVDGVAPFRAPYRESVQESAAEMAFAREYAVAVNAVLPGDCGILQLPHMVYPEQGPLEPALNDYEHFRVALANTLKRWSYGAVKQTPAGDWAAAVKPVPTGSDIDRLTAAGFCGIHLDARGFENDAFTMAVVELSARLGEPVTSGHDGDWLLFALPGSNSADS